MIERERKGDCPRIPRAAFCSSVRTIEEEEEDCRNAVSQQGGNNALSLSLGAAEWRRWTTAAAAAAAPVSNSKILIDVRLPTFLPSLSLRSHTEYSDGQKVTNCYIVRLRHTVCSRGLRSRDTEPIH